MNKIKNRIIIEDNINPTNAIPHPSSLFLRRHLVLNVSYQRHSHLCRVIAAEHITHKVCLDLHLNLEPGSSVSGQNNQRSAIGPGKMVHGSRKAGMDAGNGE